MKVYVAQNYWKGYKEGNTTRVFQSEEGLRKAVEEDVKNRIGLKGEITTKIEHISFLGIKVDTVDVYLDGEHLPNWGVNFNIVELEN